MQVLNSGRHAWCLAPLLAESFHRLLHRVLNNALVFIWGNFMKSYLGVFVSMHVIHECSYRCVYIHMCELACGGQKLTPAVFLSRLPPWFFRSLTEPAAHPPTRPACWAFCLGAEVLSPGPLACVAGSSHTEPSLQSVIGFFKKLFWLCLKSVSCSLI